MKCFNITAPRQRTGKIATNKIANKQQIKIAATKPHKPCIKPQNNQTNSKIIKPQNDQTKPSFQSSEQCNFKKIHIGLKSVSL